MVTFGDLERAVMKDYEGRDDLAAAVKEALDYAFDLLDQRHRLRALFELKTVGQPDTAEQKRVFWVDNQIITPTVAAELAVIVEARLRERRDIKGRVRTSLQTILTRV